ncbi:hypothetical protein O3G_MSEX006653 [Manduca sexta]|uniref:MADF domain-containing protein n=1 Tax=Manduca sexta TaxID=7130 RepID=A0A921Z498_MANSE|nr:hypothetical protein O3G_MSEX006653 [Manduca sexta]
MDKIIEMVRNEPCLYDTNHTNYNNKTLKEMLWARIAKDLKYKDGAAAKDSWQKLRNCHRDAIRRRKKLYKSGIVCNKTWKFEKQMEFLVPHMTNRPSTGTPSENLSQTDIKSEDIANYHDDFEEDNNDPLVDVSQFVPFPRPTLVTKTVNNHEIRPTVGDEDDLRHFFNTMYTITKKMPALTQHKLKRKIFNIISDEEEYLLQARSMADNSDSK